MIEPDFRLVDQMTSDVIGAIESPDAQSNACAALGILRLALRTLVHFTGRDQAREILRKEALDVGIATGLAASPSPRISRASSNEPFAEELVATGFWAMCIGVGALIGFILARALP